MKDCAAYFYPDVQIQGKRGRRRENKERGEKEGTLKACHGGVGTALCQVGASIWPAERRGDKDIDKKYDNIHTTVAVGRMCESG